VMLDWLLKTEEATVGYEELKLLAQDGSSWRRWRWKPAILAEYYRQTIYKNMLAVIQLLETTLVSRLSNYVTLTGSFSEIKESIKQLRGYIFARGLHFGTAPGPTLTLIRPSLM